MSLLLPNKPAFSSTRPQVFAWKKAHSREVEIFGSVFLNGYLYSSQETFENLGRFYLLKQTEDIVYFLKVVQYKDLERLEKSEEVARYLHLNGIPTSIMLPGYPKLLFEDKYVAAYENIPHRFSVSSESDLAKIGKLIASLHKELNRFPNKNEIKTRSKNRNETLVEGANRISGMENLSIPLKKIKEILSHRSTFMRVFDHSENSRSIHGDLNFGNIIFSKKTDLPIILDFEDSLISWGNPCLDLAFVIERFILKSNANEEMMISLTRIFLGTYFQNIDTRSITLDFSLTDYLYSLSIRSLLTLAELEQRNNISDKNEWNKFFENLAFIGHKEQLIKKLERIFLNL